MGALAPQDGKGGGARTLLREAGFSHVQTTAALLECEDDGPKALALLQSGWALRAPFFLYTPWHKR